MSDSQAKETATRYLKEQAEIMRKHGDSPKTQGKRFDSAVKESTKTFKVLSSTK